MAYYLYHVSASDTSGKYVDFPEVNIATSQDFEFEFEAFSTNSTFFRPFGRVENLNSRCLFLTDNVTIRLTNNTGTNLNWTVPAYTRTNFNVFKFTRASNVITLYINGVASGTPITNNGAFVFSRFFANGASAGITGAMKYFKISIGGSLVRNYVNSTGTGSVWPDIVSAQDGNQVGPWPSDDSEWVFYSSGTTDYSDTLSGATFTSSGNSLSAARGYGSTLNGGAYSSSGNTLAVTRGYSSVLNSATFTSSGGNLSATRSYSSLLNGGSYSYLGNILTSTFSGAAQSFDDAMLGGVYSSSGSTLSSFVGMSSVMLGANFTSAGGSLSSILGYSSNLSGGVYSYSGNRLISTWSGEVTVTIEGYTIMFADDSISALFGADNVSANFELDHVSVRWSN